MDYSRNVYDLVTQLQHQITSVMDSQYNAPVEESLGLDRKGNGAGAGWRRRVRGSDEVDDGCDQSGLRQHAEHGQADDRNRRRQHAGGIQRNRQGGGRGDCQEK